MGETVHIKIKFLKELKTLMDKYECEHLRHFVTDEECRFQFKDGSAIGIRSDGGYHYNIYPSFNKDNIRVGVIWDEK